MNREWTSSRTRNSSKDCQYNICICWAIWAIWLNQVDCVCVSVTPSISEVTYSMPKGMQEVCLNVQYVGFFAFCKARAAKENLQSPKCLYRSIRRKVHTISWKSGCPALTCRGPCRYPFCFFFSLFQCPTPHTLSHLQMWLSAPITGQLHLRMQEDFSTDPGDQIQDVARLARLRWDLSGDQCGSGEIYDICCFARILTAEYLRMCQVLDMTD